MSYRPRMQKEPTRKPIPPKGGAGVSRAIPYIGYIEEGSRTMPYIVEEITDWCNRKFREAVLPQEDEDFRKVMDQQEKLRQGFEDANRYAHGVFKALTGAQAGAVLKSLGDKVSGRCFHPGDKVEEIYSLGIHVAGLCTECGEQLDAETWLNEYEQIEKRLDKDIAEWKRKRRAQEVRHQAKRQLRYLRIAIFVACFMLTWTLLRLADAHLW
jgi:hypothetical protein